MEELRSNAQNSGRRQSADTRAPSTPRLTASGHADDAGGPEWGRTASYLIRGAWRRGLQAPIAPRGCTISAMSASSQQCGRPPCGRLLLSAAISIPVFLPRVLTSASGAYRLRCGRAPNIAPACAPATRFVTLPRYVATVLDPCPSLLIHVPVRQRAVQNSTPPCTVR